MSTVTPQSDLQIRRLGPGDAEASRQLGFEAFGMPTTAPTEAANLDQPGRNHWGCFDGDLLVAKLADRAYHSWFGGAEVATSGIAGVTVALEHRGRGVLTPLMAAAMESARERGAAISTLFPSAPRVYRRFSYELVSDYMTVRVPTQLLMTVAPPETEVRLRRATQQDVAEIDRIYTTWAAAQNGPLTRSGVSFPTAAEEYVADFDGVTLAVDAEDRVVGFASWDRGRGYRADANLEVSDLLALHPDAYRALLRGLGSFASVTGHTKIDTSGADVAQLFLPVLRWETVASDPYMLCVLDVIPALEARAYPPDLSTDLTFGVAAHVLTDVNGGYRLRVSDGRAECVRADPAGPVLAARGLALLYAGVQSAANLRFAGLLWGGTPADDAILDALFGGRQFHIRDYF
jgi:predicted acetyltransferase